ncbi:PREDICTED: neuromedin-B isoform X2 [Condylura cristata]|uniref:neuromedin-B isoform X2 n=1 Tax=Condylura cristata TaxID=143302 RepID=UPI000642C37E|nr:PREDICTED: neuromedin-B isoform X2 [Condylura cristata]
MPGRLGAAGMTRGAGRAPLLGRLLLLTLLASGAASPAWDLQEPRSAAGRTRVHSRGSLWATGHFMGKKSLERPNLLPLGAEPQPALRGQQLQLSRDLLRILLLKEALGRSPGRPAPHPPYRRLLVHLLQK